MGFFRGGLVLILGILLFFSFLALNSFFILGSSLKYDNVKEGLYPVLKNLSESGTGGILPEEIIGEFNVTNAAKDVSRSLQAYCRNVNNTKYTFYYKGYAIDIPCEKINETTPESIINETYNDIIYDIYYKEYDCGFWDCFSKTELPFFLVSEKARNYWMEKFYFALLASLILITFIFLLAEQKRNTLVIAGALLALSAFPILKLKDLFYAVAGNFSVLINLFLSSTRPVFLFALVLGIFLAGTGIAMNFLIPESIKKKFSVKDVKEIVKNEIAKEKQTKQIQQKKPIKNKKKPGFLSKFLKK